MDFSKLGTTQSRAHAHRDPIRIFESLPSLGASPNDLWRGQNDALIGWHRARNKKDVLISLNTGAGKTIVGLLIAQSLVNEGLDNVVYVCSTIDLVRQTSKEATDVGIEHTTRIQGRYSNDLFETGEAFCITTYSAIFNGLSSICNYHFPQAVVFDDAHVAESQIRNQFTICVDGQEEPNLFNEMKELFRPHFKELGISEKFNESIDASQFETAFVAPSGLQERTERMLAIFRAHEVEHNDSLKYQFAWLKDRLNCCSAVFGRGRLELSPPFLPSLALKIFGRDTRRIYLSATLQSNIEFIRAFGRKPDEIIVPSNDAGNGERLILDDRKVQEGFGPEFAKKLVQGHKVVISVPTYAHATQWREVAEPPQGKTFTEELNLFRKSRTGAFVLVARVDGIDLPHNTCRIMIIDGLPTGTTLLERHQWHVLQMRSVLSNRIATRLVQAFGRINRGRNDYGSFLLRGKSLRDWMARSRNRSLLPSLLRKQIEIGQEIRDQIGRVDGDYIIGLVRRVHGRDQGWLQYYERNVRSVRLREERSELQEQRESSLMDAALSEAKYAAALWRRDNSTAVLELQKSVGITASIDSLLSGWHSIWLGAAYEIMGNKEAAYDAYDVARRRLDEWVVLPRPNELECGRTTVGELGDFGRSLYGVVRHANSQQIGGAQRSKIAEIELIENGTANQAEAGVRMLGELIGFKSIRPDNDKEAGPDVLWLDEGRRQLLGFELKTKKESPATYFKKDINQGHGHLEWMKESYRGFVSLGLLFVGPDGTVDARANPSDEMRLCVLEDIVALRDQLLVLIEDLCKSSQSDLPRRIQSITSEESWNMEALWKTLGAKRLIEIRENTQSVRSG